MKIKTFCLTLCAIAASGAATGAEHVVQAGSSIQGAIDLAAPGDTVLVMPGAYHETIYIDKDRIVLRGVIKDGNWPTLDGHNELHDGILVAGHGVTVEQMFVRRFKGNGIMTQGGNNFRIIRNRVEGRSFYGIFPQFGKNGLVAWNTVWNVEDAGIYVGMCENVDITANESHHNIIGVETENSSNTLVQGNYLHDNTNGLLVSLFQGLPVKVAHNTIVRDNFIVANNTPNFAPEGSISHENPAGVGIFVFAGDGATFEGNMVRDNNSVGMFVADQSFMPGPPDPKEDPTPNNHHILNNVFLDNGRKPDGSLGQLLALLGKQRGPDVLATGLGRGNCFADPDSLSTLGTRNWSICAKGLTTAAIRTQQLPNAALAPRLTQAQKGRLTYLAVCTGCHSYSMRLIGPPMVTVQALYRGHPELLAKWIAAPTKKRPDFEEMPPQNYLPEDVRLAVARYILEDLRP